MASMNISTEDFREMIAQVFEELGGKNAFIAWAKENVTIFYKDFFRELLTEPEEISDKEEQLKEKLSDWAEQPKNDISLKEILNALEKTIILTKLKKNQWNVTLTANQLKIDRSHLYKRLQVHGVDISTIKKVSPFEGENEKGDSSNPLL